MQQSISIKIMNLILYVLKPGFSNTVSFDLTIHNAALCNRSQSCFNLLAICQNDCVNCGKCISPGTCSCKSGWIGNTCSEGKCID